MLHEVITEQIYNLYTEIAQANRYAIEYNGVDGHSRRSFTALGDVAKFLKDRDLGVEYRRNGYLQGEYASFTFRGFGWEDILTGPYHDENSNTKQISQPPTRWCGSLEKQRIHILKFVPARGTCM